jgi:hypothetical protein
MPKAATEKKKWPVYMAVSMGYWGRGKTIEAAIKKLQEQGGHGETIIYGSTDPTIQLNECGYILWDRGTEYKKVDRIEVEHADWCDLCDIKFTGENAVMDELVEASSIEDDALTVCKTCAGLQRKKHPRIKEVW